MNKLQANEICKAVDETRRALARLSDVVISAAPKDGIGCSDLPPGVVRAALSLGDFIATNLHPLYEDAKAIADA